MQKQNLYSAGSVSVLPLTEASWRMEQETEGGWSRGAVGKRKSSRGDGAWLATGAVVLTVRHTAAGRRRRRRGGAVVVGWILGGCVGGGASLSGCCCPQTVLWELQPASLSVAVCPTTSSSTSSSAQHGAPSVPLHMTAQKTTSRWLYSPSFVHFQHRDTRQIMLNDRRWLPEEWLLCCRCQVCKC